jgi:hypothetical protein
MTISRWLSSSPKHKRWMRPLLTNTPLSIVAAFVTFYPVATRAQGARDYLNTPVNAASAFVDFVTANSETASESDLSLPNNEAVSRFGVITGLWSFPLAGKYGGVALTGGYASVNVKGPLGKLSTSGFTDPSITFHANIFGAPALTREQFAEAIPHSYSSVHLTVTAPLGSYDRNSPVNTGANRWAFSPVVNLDLTPDKGVSWFDLYAGVRLFTSNNAFQGNNQLSQHPLGVFSAHYSHNLGKRMFVGIGANYDYGGESIINGVSQHNTANGFRPGVSFGRARTIGKFALILRYELTATTPRALPTNGLLSIRLSGPLF